MMVVWIVAAVYCRVAAVATANAIANYKHVHAYTDCPPTPKLYKELRCTPIIDVAVHGDRCPRAYDCNNAGGTWQGHRPPPPGKCSFNGNTYALGASVNGNNDRTVPPCMSDCECTGNTTSAQFECVQVDCPVFYDVPPLWPSDNCIHVATFDECCPEKRICGDRLLADLATCRLEQREYRVGEMMYPASMPCHRCACTRHFSNASAIGDNVACREISCGIELYAQRELRRACAPVFVSSATSCCPIAWQCPDTQDRFIAAENGVAPSWPDGRCIFGEHTTVPIGGQVMNARGECVLCTCNVPPLLDCVYSTRCTRV